MGEASLPTAWRHLAGRQPGSVHRANRLLELLAGGRRQTSGASA